MLRIRCSATAELPTVEARALRHLLEDAYEDGFGEDDWQHCLGGVHVLGWLERELVAHASVVERWLHCADRALRAGYVEGVAVRQDCRRKGFATAVMLAVEDIILCGYELGALGDGAGIEGFYQRLGWRVWLGPTWVITPNGRERSEDEDGCILVLLTEATPELDLTEPLACEAWSPWRPPAFRLAPLPRPWAPCSRSVSPRATRCRPVGPPRPWGASPHRRWRDAPHARTRGVGDRPGRDLQPHRPARHHQRDVRVRPQRSRRRSGPSAASWYWYRFRSGSEFSPVGRTHTAPAAGANPERLRFAFASCSQYEHGYFTAYRRLAEEDLDFAVHLGDYIYEYPAHDYVAPGGNVRDHVGPETVTLADYRQRHAQYKTDPDCKRRTPRSLGSSRGTTTRPRTTTRTRSRGGPVARGVP